MPNVPCDVPQPQWRRRNAETRRGVGRLQRGRGVVWTFRSCAEDKATGWLQVACAVRRRLAGRDGVATVAAGTSRERVRRLMSAPLLTVAALSPHAPPSPTKAPRCRWLAPTTAAPTRGASTAPPAASMHAPSFAAHTVLGHVGTAASTGPRRPTPVRAAATAPRAAEIWPPAAARAATAATHATHTLHSARLRPAMPTAR